MNVTITSMKNAGNGKYLNVTTTRPSEMSDIRPGQYVELEAGHGKQYFVISSHDDESLTFVMGRKSPFVDVLQPRQDLGVRGPLGGYNVSDVVGRNVICFAGGSGIAAIVPVIKHVHSVYDGISPCDLYYSETNDEFVCLDDLESFRSTCDSHVFMTQGVLREYVDESILGMIAKLTDHMPISFPIRPIVFVCGSKDYVARLKKELVPRLVYEEDFRVNF